jgi:hypothetical protein
MLLTNHFPEEIRKEIELDKIKVTEKSSMGNITLTGRDPQRAAKIKIKRAKKAKELMVKLINQKEELVTFFGQRLICKNQISHVFY